jgi:hypothetical protein
MPVLTLVRLLCIALKFLVIALQAFIPRTHCHRNANMPLMQFPVGNCVKASINLNVNSRIDNSDEARCACGAAKNFELILNHRGYSFGFAE